MTHSFPTRRSSDRTHVVQHDAVAGQPFGRRFAFPLLFRVFEVTAAIVGMALHGLRGLAVFLQARLGIGAGGLEQAVSGFRAAADRKSTRLNASHSCASRMPPPA